MGFARGSCEDAAKWLVVNSAKFRKVHLAQLPTTATTFNRGIVRRLARTTETQLHPMGVSP